MDIDESAVPHGIQMAKPWHDESVIDPNTLLESITEVPFHRGQTSIILMRGGVAHGTETNMG